MARADLLCDLIKSSLNGNGQGIRKAAEAISAEERSIHHEILAQKIDDMLRSNCIPPLTQKENGDSRSFMVNKNATGLFCEKHSEKTLEHLILSDSITKTCREMIEEQMRSDLLRSYGVEPRNKVLLIGPPGNGKTSLAGAIANELMVPLYMVQYENVVGSYLGETASRLAKLFDYVRTRQCVLFFDEFETLGKERGDEHETGEIKRVVSSLLLQIDALPSYVVIIAATNHDKLLDSAVWRRFQIKLELPKPTENEIELWLSRFEKHNHFKFDVGINAMAKMLVGKSYAEAEDFALSVYRQYILHQPNANMRNITETQLRNFFYNSRKKSDKEEMLKHA
jgi:AAA+ superfamily predicted ATPase